jgi:hypothetical protein
MNPTSKVQNQITKVCDVQTPQPIKPSKPASNKLFDKMLDNESVIINNSTKIFEDFLKQHKQ